MNKVARLAGVNEKQIYRYFGNFDHLVETDYWMRFADYLGDLYVPHNMESMKHLLGNVQ